jgi:hypothetical protein
LAITPIFKKTGRFLRLITGDTAPPLFSSGNLEGPKLFTDFFSHATEMLSLIV